MALQPKLADAFYILQSTIRTRGQGSRLIEKMSIYIWYRFGQVFFRLIMFPFLSSATLLLTKNRGTIFTNKTKKILRDRITLLGKSFGCIKSMWLLYCRFQFFEFEPFVSYWKIYIAR